MDHKRNVLITGASSGVGKATARRFAWASFRVFGTSRRPEPDDSGIEMLELDLRSPDSVEHCVAEVLSRATSIDVLVNNAGVMHWGFAKETTMDEAHALFETNFFGPARMMKAVLPNMRKARRGRITTSVINVGSLAAWVGEPGEAYYSASKRALAGRTYGVSPPRGVVTRHPRIADRAGRVPNQRTRGQCKGPTEHRRL